jgi:ribosome-associated protein
MTAPENDPGEKNPLQFRQVEIQSEPVELYKILKFEGLVTSGGQAKAVVVAGQVRVNGKVETQKRKKIVGGDTIEFDNEKIAIKLLAADGIEDSEQQ